MSSHILIEKIWTTVFIHRVKLAFSRAVSLFYSSVASVAQFVGFFCSTVNETQIPPDAETSETVKRVGRETVRNREHVVNWKRELMGTSFNASIN